MKQISAIMPFVARILVICVAGAVLAAVVNAVSPAGISWLPRRDGSALTNPDVLRQVGVSVEQAVAMLEESQTVVIDARSAEQFADGHIPGAINVCSSELPEAAEPLYEVLPVAEDMGEMKVLIYCQGQDCIDSVRVFDYLSELGYRQSLRVLTEGFGSWWAAELPVEEGQGP